MARFHSLIAEEYSIIHTYHIFIHSSINGYLGSFHTLAIVDSAVLNMGCMCPFKTAHLYPVDKCLVVQLLGRVVLFLVFWGTSILFSRVAAPTCIPTNNAKRSSFSASSPTSVVAWVVNVRHSDRCEVVSHCGFDLYFPDDEWCGSFFHVSFGHMDVFLGEVSIHVFCPFLHWMICFLGVEFDKFFIDFGY